MMGGVIAIAYVFLLIWDFLGAIIFSGIALGIALAMAINSSFIPLSISIVVLSICVYIGIHRENRKRNAKLQVQ